MIHYIFLILFFLQFSTTFGDELKYCYIKDQNQHAHNQKLLRTIIDRELTSYDLSTTPVEKANFLAARVSQISQELVKSGFLAEAYAIPNLDRNSIVAFNCFALWEGKCIHDSIPLTFFVYVWPPEKLALQYQGHHSPKYYSSSIHSHPIPCAFATIQGVLIQKRFEPLAFSGFTKRVKLVKEDYFGFGEGEYDDLKQLSIHQLYTKNGTTPCLSLHAYGMSSSENVLECFKQTLPTHTYYEF